MPRNRCGDCSGTRFPPHVFRTVYNRSYSNPSRRGTGAFREKSGRMRDYIELTKPRITWLILMSTAIGYFFGLPEAPNWRMFLLHIPLSSLLHTLVGTGLLASGTAALNQWFEREADRRMRRTADRPLPAGRLLASHALA